MMTTMMTVNDHNHNKDEEYDYDVIDYDDNNNDHNENGDRNDILQILTSMVKIILVAMKTESKTNQGTAIKMVRRTY